MYRCINVLVVIIDVFLILGFCNHGWSCLSLHIIRCLHVLFAIPIRFKDDRVGDRKWDGGKPKMRRICLHATWIVPECRSYGGRVKISAGRKKEARTARNPLPRSHCLIVPHSFPIFAFIHSLVLLLLPHTSDQHINPITMRGEHCVAGATILSVISVILLIFAHIGQVSSGALVRSIYMAEVNVAA